MHLAITIDMDALCAECGKGGAVTKVGGAAKEDGPGCGLCMKCAGKAMSGRGVVKSPEAKAVRARARK